MGVSKYPLEFEKRVVEAFINRGDKRVDDISLEFGVSTSRVYAWWHKHAPTPATSEDDDDPNDRTGYARNNVKDDSGVLALFYERDRLKEEAAALRKTIVLLGRK